MKKHVYANMAGLIRSARINKGISQIELAAAMGYDSPQSISNTERQLASVPVLQFKVVAKVLGIKPQALVEAYLADQRESIKRSIGV